MNFDARWTAHSPTDKYELRRVAKTKKWQVYNKTRSTSVGAVCESKRIAKKKMKALKKW